MAGFKESFAIVIGINTYQQGIPALKTAANDAEEITQILQGQHGYTTLLFLDQAATRSALLKLLTEKLPGLVTTDDRCLFYFAGHGIALNGEDGPEGYLIPQDARLGDVSTYLPMSQVHKALLQLPCRHFLGILDCCFAGAFRWSSTRKLVPVELGTIHKERFDRFIQDPAWQILTSAAYDQTALDAFDLKDDRGQTGEHSPFATILIEALQGKADAYPLAEPGKPAGDGVLTATELYLYLRDRIEVATEARAMRQTPGICPLSKHDKGEYIFLSPGHELNLPPAPPLDSSKNPYRGLEAFEEEHCELFFGRKALTQKLYEFVISHSLTVVLGASGSGKSSLVKAGLVPKLRHCKDDASWAVFPPFRPGEAPFRAVNKALVTVNFPEIAVPGESAPNSATPVQQLAQWFEEHPQVNLLLVIDQFEELITLCRNDKERQQFLESLAAAIKAHPDQLHLVLTLRSDFEPQFRNTPLEPYWQAARFVVPAMTREELRQAIEEPASARVMYFNPHELVDQLIDEVAQMPGALPLLSFALSELYLKYLKRQDEAKQQGETIDRAITQADYEEVGGVTRSLTQRADQEYSALVQKDPDYEYTIRNVMLRMVSVGGELARRRVPLSELEYAEPENGRVQKVLERFETARLLTPGTDIEEQPYQEPAHDALVRGWKRLIDWKQKHLGSLILQRELTSDVNQWKTSSQKKQELGLLWIEDPRLPAALQLSCGRSYKDNWINLFKWRFNYQLWQSQACDCWFNQLESDFIWRSLEQRFRRFGKTAIAVAGGILALSGVTIYALERATIAQLREQSSRVLNWLPTPNAVEGVVLAIDTLNRSRSIPSLEMTSQSSLLSAIQVVQEVNLLQHEDEGEVYAVAFSPDGKRIVSGSEDKTIRLWDAQTGRAIEQPLRGHEERVFVVAFSPDGTRIVSGSGDKTIRLWDAQTGKPIGQPLQGHENAVRSVAFSPDGKRIVSSSEDKTIRLWDARTGEAIKQLLQEHEASVWSVAFSPDGKRIVSGSGDKTIRLWDAQTGKPIGQPLRGHEEDVSAVAFSPDGKRIVSGSGDKTIRLWDAQTGKPIGQPLRGHEVVVSTVAFSLDGKRIVSGSWDKTVRLWDAQTGELIGQPLQGHEAPVSSVAFSLDGKRIVSGSSDKTVRLWDAQMEQATGHPLQGHGALVSSVAFSRDGRRIVSGSGDKTMRLWDAQTGEQVRQPLRGHGASVNAVAFSPDGMRIASSNGQMVQLWDAQTGEQVGQPLRGHGAPVSSVAFSPDGKRIVSGSGDKSIRLWDAQTGEQVGQPLRGHEAPVSSVAFSPDGKRIVSGSGDKSIRLWDAQTGEQVEQPLRGHGAPVSSVAFSPDGKRIVSGSDDRTVRLWDAQTGQPIGQSLDQGAPVSSVAFSPDGKRIVSGSDDRMVRLWDAQTGQPIGQPLQGHGDAVNAVAFSPDGKRIASSSGDKTVRLWNASPDDWLIIACNRLQYHPILNHPETITTDPELLKVAQRARTVCQHRVWRQRLATVVSQKW